jgi:hypothetical protein
MWFVLVGDDVRSPRCLKHRTSNIERRTSNELNKNCNLTIVTLASMKMEERDGERRS